MPFDPQDCRSVFERMVDYVDRELTPEEVSLVETHLLMCGHCAAAFRWEESILRVCRKSMEELMPKEFESQILDKIKNGS